MMGDQRRNIPGGRAGAMPDIHAVRIANHAVMPQAQGVTKFVTDGPGKVFSVFRGPAGDRIKGSNKNKTRGISGIIGGSGGDPGVSETMSNSSPSLRITIPFLPPLGIGGGDKASHPLSGRG